MIFDILRTVLIMENEDINFAFRTALSHAAVVGAEYYSALETGLDRLDGGRLFHPGELLPSQVALKLLNVHGGLICAPLDYMRYHYPDRSDSEGLRGVRELTDRVKAIAVRVIKYLHVDFSNNRIAK